MKKHYENLLRVIVDDYYENRRRFTTLQDVGISEREAEFLAAKGLCSMPLALDGVSCISPTDEGLTYFEDKKERLKFVFIQWSFNFAMAVLSAACGSAATLLIQHVLMK